MLRKWPRVYKNRPHAGALEWGQPHFTIMRPKIQGGGSGGGSGNNFGK